MVGFGHLVYDKSEPFFYVGRVRRGVYEYVGMGASWEEAFRNTRRVLFHLPPSKLVLEELPEPKQGAAK